MGDTVTEHVVEGIKVRVFDLPGGSYCALIVDTDVVYQATFNAELKPLSVLTDHVHKEHRYDLPTASPTPEMLLVMKLAALEHIAHLGED